MFGDPNAQSRCHASLTTTSCGSVSKRPRKMNFSLQTACFVKSVLKICGTICISVPHSRPPVPLSPPWFMPIPPMSIFEVDITLSFCVDVLYMEDTMFFIVPRLPLSKGLVDSLRWVNLAFADVICVRFFLGDRKLLPRKARVLTSAHRMVVGRWLANNYATLLCGWSSRWLVAGRILFMPTRTQVWAIAHR